jgi:hypothetical protein
MAHAPPGTFARRTRLGPTRPAWPALITTSTSTSTRRQRVRRPVRGRPRRRRVAPRRRRRSAAVCALRHATPSHSGPSQCPHSGSGNDSLSHVGGWVARCPRSQGTREARSSTGTSRRPRCTRTPRRGGTSGGSGTGRRTPRRGMQTRRLSMRRRSDFRVCYPSSSRRRSRTHHRSPWVESDSAARRRRGDRRPTLSGRRADAGAARIPAVVLCGVSVWARFRGAGESGSTHRTEPAVSLCYYHDASHPSLPPALDENICFRPREVVRRQAVMGSAHVDPNIRVTLAQRLLGLPVSDAAWAPDAVPVPPDACDRLQRRFRTMSTFLRTHSVFKRPASPRPSRGGTGPDRSFSECARIRTASPTPRTFSSS